MTGPPDIAGMFYDAAVGEAGWQNAVEALSRYLGDVTMQFGDGVPDLVHTYDFGSARFDDTALDEIGLSPRDAFDPELNPSLKAANFTIPLCRSIDCRVHTSDAMIRNSALLSAIMIGPRMCNGRTFTVSRSTECLAGGAISTPYGTEEYDSDMIARLDAVLPVLARAVALKQKLRVYERGNAALTDFVERLSVPVIVVDTDLSVGWANAAATVILEARDGVQMLRRRLIIGEPARTELCAGVRRAKAQTDRMPNRCLVSRPSGLPAYEITILPAIDLVGGGRRLRGAATLTIADPVAKTRLPSIETLMTRYGLTAAEARVARLVPLGLTKARMADRMGLSENTIRTHVRELRAKLGAANMVELAVLLSR